jgi:GABA permease
MVYKRQMLVLANVTATSGELIDVLTSRAASGPAAVTLIVPVSLAAASRSSAEQTLARALDALREAGLEAEGQLGDSDPMVAITEAWDPKRYDEIIVSTLPTSMSKWLQADLPRRIARRTDALVTHVVAEPPREAPHAVSVAPAQRRGVLSPLSPLTWGARPSARQ